MASRKTKLPEVAVDPKLKKRWDTLSAQIAAAIARDASAFDERWEAAARIVDHDPPLYVFGGHASAAAFFRDVMHESPRNAQRFVRVAKVASPRDEATYGVHLIDRALAWIEAKRGEPLDGALPTPLAKLRITIERDGKERTLPLAEVTIQEVEAATKKLLGAKGRSRAKPKGEAQKALEASLRADGALAGVRVQEKGGLVRIDGIPIAAWEVFRKAIAGSKIDGGAAPAAKGKGEKAEPRRGRGAPK